MAIAVLQENSVVADRFRLVRMIGRGGMGSVWEAKHLGLDTACALKFIEGELSNVAEAHSRFEREAKAAAQLRSQHVVQIFDHGVWQGIPYIAMELLRGEDLGKRLQRGGGRLDPRDVVTVIHQVCRALNKAHGAGVVHRDLKPDNIFLVQEDEERELVKILDFGVAKQTGQAIEGSSTKTGAMLGTPYYMSPEQAQGIKAVDARSDLWSLAVIVFQALTGKLPFESEALGDLLVKIIVGEAPSPMRYNPSLPRSFEEWWVKASQKPAENRFQTAKIFSEELSRALNEAPAADLSERNRVPRVGGATAVMSNAANTPFPQSQQQQSGFTSTPNPYPPPSPSSSGGIGVAPNMMTPPGFGQTPQPHGAGGMPVAGTFSGVVPPVTTPKKGIPALAIAACGVLFVGGIALAGYAFLARKHAHAGNDPASSASVAAPSATVAAAGTAPPAPSATVAVAAADPNAGGAPTAAAKEPDPAPAPTTAPAAPRPASAPGHRPAPAVVASAKPPTTTKPEGTKPAGASPAGKPIPLGF